MRAKYHSCLQQGFRIPQTNSPTEWNIVDSQWQPLLPIHYHSQPSKMQFHIAQRLWPKPFILSHPKSKFLLQRKNFRRQERSNFHIKTQTHCVITLQREITRSILPAFLGTKQQPAVEQFKLQRKNSGD